MGLTLHDPALAAFVAEAQDADRAALAERALRIGLLAICNANATVNVDVVRAEFTRLVSDLAATQAEAAQTLETTLRTNFADGDGRLPRQLEAYLGDSGKLNRLVGDLFDEGVATPRSAGFVSCWAATSTVTARSSPRCSTRPAAAARSTSSAPR